MNKVDLSNRHRPDWSYPTVIGLHKGINVAGLTGLHICITVDPMNQWDIIQVVQEWVHASVLEIDRGFNTMGSSKPTKIHLPLDALEEVYYALPQLTLSPQFRAILAARDGAEPLLEPWRDVHIEGLGVTPLPHQVALVNYWQDLPLDAYGCKRMAVGDEMGVMKTLSTLMALMSDRDNYLPSLVVCPNTIKYAAWAGDIEKFTDLTYSVLDGPNGSKEAALDAKADVYIVNYESTWRVKGLFDKVPFQSIVLDEHHRIKTHNAKQTKACISLGREIPHMIALSGTPIVNGKLEERWAIAHLLDPNKYPSHYMFVENMCVKSRSGAGIVGYRPNAVKHFQEFMHKREIRRRKDQVLKDLPDMVFERFIIPMNDETKRIYKRIKEQSVVELKKLDGSGKPQTQKVINALSQMTRLKQAAFSPELFGGSDKSAKVDELKRLVREIVESGQKVIVFSQWKTATRIIERELKKILKDHSIAYIDGTIPVKKRALEVKKFQEDDNCMAFIGTIGACKEGITLTAASYVIFTDKGWTPAENDQAAARAHRYGQKSSVTVIDLFSEDTIEAKVEDMLQKKRNVSNAVIERDGGKEIEVKNRETLSLRELMGLI